MGYGKQRALCHNPMASNNVDMFCFLTLPIPVPQPKWMGLANRVKALVQGAQRLLKRSNVAVPASEVTLSVFFLPPAFPSALAVCPPHGPTVKDCTKLMLQNRGT